MSGTLAQPSLLSPAPILDAVDRYRGSMVDLDASRIVGPDEFSRTRELLIGQLRRQGLSPGDRVLMAVANGPLFVATLTSILACDGSPLLVHAKTPAAELARYAQRFGVRFLACDPPEDDSLADIETTAVTIPVGDLAVLHWGTMTTAESEVTGPELRGVPLHPTSGSTGLPKVALRPGFAAIEEARHYTATMAITADDSIVATPPMSHAYGYGMCVMVPLLTGASIVSTRRFSVKQIHRALRECPVTILPTVPAMLEVLSFGAAPDFRPLRWVLAAGSPLPRRSAERFGQKTRVTVCPLYGTTETGGISVATAADGQDVDGRVGPAMDGIEVKIVPHEDGAALGKDIGKLAVRSSSMMTGYLDEQGGIAAAQDDGWFETGDLARIAEDGTIHLRGRDSDVINVSGLKVVPCEVEDAITSLPGVREVKVYAGEHRTGTQIVKAAVAVEDGVSLADIRSQCESQLVYYKRPQTITLIDALPRNPAGKIIRDQLP